MLRFISPERASPYGATLGPSRAGVAVVAR